MLEGAALALEQCGLLLCNGNTLYCNRAHANAVVLAAFAREELGRYKILLDLRRRTLAGEAFAIEQVRDACRDHEAKQKAGMLSITIGADSQSGIGKILRAKMENNLQSAAWRTAESQLEQIDKEKKKRTPGERHQKRMSALYVEPARDSSEWNRPSVISRAEAYRFLNDAINDYRHPYHHRYPTSPSASALLKDDDPELWSALDAWSDRPELPLPEHPPFSDESHTGAVNMSSDQSTASGPRQMSEHVHTVFKELFAGLESIKQQQWKIANYAVLLLAGVFAAKAAKTTVSPSIVVLLPLLPWLIALGGSGLLLSLQWNLGRYRNRIDRLHKAYFTEQELLDIDLTESEKQNLGRQTQCQQAHRGWDYFLALTTVLWGGALLVWAANP